MFCGKFRFFPGILVMYAGTHISTTGRGPISTRKFLDLFGAAPGGAFGPLKRVTRLSIDGQLIDAPLEERDGNLGIFVRE